MSQNVSVYTFQTQPSVRDTQVQAGKSHVRFEDSPAVTMKNAVFWDIKPLPYRAQPVNVM
jgi:hypothetical protein